MIKIYSNFNNCLAKFNLDFESFEPKLENKKLSPSQAIVDFSNKLDCDKTYFFFIRFMGRRIVENIPIIDRVDLISGRRHKLYSVFVKENKAKIKFGWHKIKRLSCEEKKFIAQNWEPSFFENQGRKFIIQSGGVVFWENFLSNNIESGL
jgi:hypothetical protein